MNTFCVLPWYSLELPVNNPCCLLPDNTDIDQLKIDLLNGVKAEPCKKCWVIESQNQKSRRQLENEFLDYKLDRDLTKIRQDCVENKNQILLYQLRTSNLCNQACVSCNSSASTKWAEIERKMDLVPRPFTTINLLSNKINYSSAKRISLLGGEPFFDPKTFEILNQLITHKNVDCFISLVTNGSIQLKQEQLDLLSKFKNLNICISIDGTGSVFEYLRWPGKWSAMCDNVKLLKNITDNISVSYTISSLNIFYHQQTVNWFDQQGLRYNHNIVSQPEWLSLDSMPVAIKQLLSNNEFAQPWTRITGNEINLTEYYNKIKQQDQAKQTSIYQYLPEIAVIFDNLS